MTVLIGQRPDPDELVKGEREATEDEIAVLGAEHGPFQPEDGEG